MSSEYRFTSQSVTLFWKEAKNSLYSHSLVIVKCSTNSSPNNSLASSLFFIRWAASNKVRGNLFSGVTFLSPTISSGNFLLKGN